MADTTDQEANITYPREPAAETYEGAITQVVEEEVSRVEEKLGPLNKHGFTVLEHYTPARLAEYLDVKPFKITGELMRLLGPDRVVCTVHDQIKRSQVEAVCAKLSKPAPWEHPNLGKNVALIQVNKQCVYTSNIVSILRSNYPRAVLGGNLERRLAKLGVTALPAKQFSASGLYALLKELRLDPEILMNQVQPAKVPGVPQTVS